MKRRKDGKPEVENQLRRNGTTSPGEGKHCTTQDSELHQRAGEQERLDLLENIKVEQEFDKYCALQWLL